ncbi:hypothetical protein [Bacillus vallismortis]|nr:hypothetical protein [Bacillus vallismortis]
MKIAPGGHGKVHDSKEECYSMLRTILMIIGAIVVIGAIIRFVF